MASHGGEVSALAYFLEALVQWEVECLNLATRALPLMLERRRNHSLARAPAKRPQGLAAPCLTSRGSTSRSAFR